MSPSASLLADTIVVFFSRPGENYFNGGRRTLTTGNTAVLAQMLVDRLGCSVHELEASEPYPSGYDAAVARNVTEQQNDSRPAIAGPLPSFDGYSTVLLGSPIWNVRPPMIMNTFVEGIDWTGKTLHPFVTYAVSGLGRTAQVYERAARGAQLGDGLAVRGEEAAGAGDQAAAWLRSISLL